MNLNDVKQFLKDFEEGVVATVDSSGKPEAATVGLSCDDSFKFMIASNESTRKVQNLKANRQIAIVVGFSGPKTLQVDGTVEEVSRDTHAERISLHFDEVPEAKRYENEPGQVYLLITPTWLRFTDYTQEQPIFETENFS